MKKDKLYQWFLEHSVKSISPLIATMLIDVAGKLRLKIITVKDDEIRKDLEAYMNALIIVCDFAAIHQKAVIDKLSILIRDRSSDDI